MLETGTVCIVGVTGMIGMILCLRKMDWLLRFATRISVGVVLMYGTNIVMELLGMESRVGINLWTILSAGIFGVPGVVLWYVLAYV